ncbi:MAG TPA: carboxymuconolactone decarboxylase family protein [Cyclobacteriaceae bacterium]|nr:carboxymuconolactone decarboxylase family protein [Cyclobacteriaceae bacterium]
MNTTVTKEFVYALSTESFGMVPGVIKGMAERSVPLAYMYLVGTQTMEKSSFSVVEINAIELRISALNKCESCMKGHSFLLKKAGVTDDDVQAILRGEETSIDRLSKLLKAAEYIYYSGNGVYPDLVLNFFTEEKISEQEVIEIVGLISLKTISNFVNNYLVSVQQQKAVKA